MKSDRNSNIDLADSETQNDLRHKAVLSMGSNLGDRLLLLRESLQHLEFSPKVEISKVSSVYETDPVGYPDQPLFYNIVVEVFTDFEPLELLRFCQQIEKQFHRERKVRWGPRTIDIDIIIYDDIQMDTQDLTIPHPRMNDREFVMLPWKEIETGQVQISRHVRPVFSRWY